MKSLSNLLLFLLMFSVGFIACNKTGEKKSVNKSSDKKSSKNSNVSAIKKANGESKKNKKFKDTAYLKAEIIIKDGVMKQLLSKLDIYMSKLPPQQVALIKSLKIESFKGLYFLMTKEKMYLKINGLNILDIIEIINKKNNAPKQEYKTYKNLKYFTKNSRLTVSDGVDSYISSENLSIEDIANNYNMNINENLESLIKESKNNGFYVAFAGDIIKEKLAKNLPPFMKSLTGVSLFSYTEKNTNKLRLIVKLNEKDATLAAEKLTTMYKMYLPMLLQQTSGYEKLLGDKKELTQNEKDAYKKLTEEFKEMLNTVDIKSDKTKVFVTINIKSLELSVALTGILAAVAIPAYLGYIQKSKANLMKTKAMKEKMEEKAVKVNTKK